jgi:hypothetical protein
MNFSRLALCALFLTFFALTGLQAQQVYVWDFYKVAVTLPDDFKVVTNNDNEFECAGDGMHLYMYVFDDGEVTLDQMGAATRRAGRQMKFEMKDEEYDVSHNGFEGTYMLGYAEGVQVMLAGLINPGNNTNFFVAIVFEDGDEVALEDGLAILNSLDRTK